MIWKLQKCSENSADKKMQFKKMVIVKYVKIQLLIRWRKIDTKPFIIWTVLQSKCVRSCAIMSYGYNILHHMWNHNDEKCNRFVICLPLKSHLQHLSHLKNQPLLYLNVISVYWCFSHFPSSFLHLFLLYYYCLLVFFAKRTHVLLKSTHHCIFHSKCIECVHCKWYR